MSFDQTWTTSIAEDLRAMLRSRKTVFVHVGALHGGYFDDISSKLGSVRILDATEFCSDNFDDMDDERAEYSVVIVKQVDVLKDRRHGTLGQLRARVHAAVAKGFDVCLVSDSSRESFPPEPGSTILFEVARYVLQLCIPKDSDRYLLSRVPAIYEDGSLEFRSLFAKGLAQVSITALVELDRALYDMGRDEAAFIEELPLEVQEELRQAGFLVRVQGEDLLQFCVPARFNHFRLAVADAISWVALPPAWAGDTFEVLFELERLIRRKIREAAGGLKGESWKKGLVTDENQVEKLLGHVHSDGYFLIPSVESLRDPLEWMTLGELLDLVRSKFSNLNCQARVWDSFAREVLPVRNRIGHMRLTSAEDLRTVRRWQSTLSRMLS